MPQYQPNDPRHPLQKARLAHQHLHKHTGTGARIQLKDLKAYLRKGLGIVSDGQIHSYVHALHDHGLITVDQERTGQGKQCTIHAPQDSENGTPAAAASNLATSNSGAVDSS